MEHSRYLRAKWETIPGNLNSSHPTEKCIFQQLLPLDPKGYELRLHRESDTVGPVCKHSTLLDSKCHLT